MTGRLLLLLATAIFLHAAFSTYEHLTYLKALGKPESIPFDVVLETFVALLIGIVGASANAPPLKEISWASEMKKRSIDEMDSRLGFANWVSRGGVLYTAERSRDD